MRFLIFLTAFVACVSAIPISPGQIIDFITGHKHDNLSSQTNDTTANLEGAKSAELPKSDKPEVEMYDDDKKVEEDGPFACAPEDQECTNKKNRYSEPKNWMEWITNAMDTCTPGDEKCADLRYNHFDESSPVKEPTKPDEPEAEKSYEIGWPMCNIRGVVERTSDFQSSYVPISDCTVRKCSDACNANLTATIKSYDPNGEGYGKFYDIISSGFKKIWDEFHPADIWSGCSSFSFDEKDPSGCTFHEDPLERMQLMKDEDNSQVHYDGDCKTKEH